MSHNLVWFRQDLRLQDNPALTAALESGSPTLLVYIFDHETAGPWAVGKAQQWWLHHSLSSLQVDLKKQGHTLVLKRGNTQRILEELRTQCAISHIYWNRCYEPTAIKRDETLKRDLKNRGIEVQSFNGSLLFEPWTIQNNQKEFFKVFTPFWKNCLSQVQRIRPLIEDDLKRLQPLNTPPESDKLESWNLLPQKPIWAQEFPEHWSPGESSAHKRLKDFTEYLIASYKESRDIPSIDGTSRLSPHLHFGEVSPHQIWHAITQLAPTNGHECYLREIGWREFCYHLLYHFPRLPDTSFREEFDQFPWENDLDLLHAWKRGLTGYPIVDAGMRQLWHTGWMHNRVRMIVGSFLTKDLFIDWRLGETWFWDTLVDADLANNAAGWQWIAGSGADAQPYFRIFNPLLQSQKFDPKGAYIRRWIPELAGLSDEAIHAPWLLDERILRKCGVALGQTYPHPIVDHGKQKAKALGYYQKIKKTL